MNMKNIFREILFCGLSLKNKTNQLHQVTTHVNNSFIHTKNCTLNKLHILSQENTVRFKVYNEQMLK